MIGVLPPLDGVVALPDAMCVALHDACAHAGYTEDTLRVISNVPRTIQGAAIPLLRRALLTHRAEASSQTHAAGILALLFACQDEVEESAARATLGVELTGELLASGLIARSPTASTVCSNFRLLPLEGMWLLADHPTGGPAAVMPPGPTTAELIGVMPARHTGTVLDVGCGPGSLALVAARRGASCATGIDINPRAIQMAEFNARLNGLSGLSFVVGDVAEPVRGARFDMLVAQPPYVVQPPGSAVIAFLHGGPTGEAITLRILAALPELLAPGARALVLAEAPTPTSEPLHQRFRKEFENAPVDIVVLTSPGSSPDRQALVYATFEAPESGPEYAAAVARYADHLDELGIREFTHALIVARLRNPSAQAEGLRFAATIPIKQLSDGDGEAIDVLMASLDMASFDDETLAAASLRASPFARWIEERPVPNPDAQPTHAVHFAAGRFASDIDNLTAGACRLTNLVDCAASVEEAAREYAHTSGLDWSTAQAQMLRFVREALGRGLLERRV
jgi:SAM-dependent methyltransferase